jgi:hypothetical protein
MLGAPTWPRCSCSHPCCTHPYSTLRLCRCCAAADAWCHASQRSWALLPPAEGGAGGDGCAAAAAAHAGHWLAAAGQQSRYARPSCYSVLLEPNVHDWSCTLSLHVVRLAVMLLLCCVQAWLRGNDTKYQGAGCWCATGFSAFTAYNRVEAPLLSNFGRRQPIFQSSHSSNTTLLHPRAVLTNDIFRGQLLILFDRINVCCSDIFH